MRMSPMDMINVGVIAGVVAMIAVGGINANPGIDPITTASVKTSVDRFTVVDHVGGNTCILGLKRADGYGVHMVEPGSDCGRISKRLADTRAWQEASSGTVTLTDSSGSPLIRLAPGDGIAYEIIEPRDLSVSLEAF